MLNDATDRPEYRGLLHARAFFAAVPLGAWLISAVSAEARIPVAVYVFSLCGVLGTSGAYHRGNWTPTLRRWMRRLDHSMIFFLIAGTYTPLALLACQSELAHDLLWAVWAAAAGGVVMKLVWIDAPDAVGSLVYLATAWMVGLAIPEIYTVASPTAALLILMGGAVYTAGALVFVFQRPDPLPKVFGYHEVFHVCTLVGAGAHYVAVSLIAL